ncbi:MAG: hypothetical protein M1812_008376 [Candelaria pacifica]|nr:MAG: hypothetical protein M1812_008376 [Candelaria pacifica]
MSSPLKTLSQSHNQDDEGDDFSDATEIPDHQTNHPAVSEEGEEIDKDAYRQVMKKQVLKMLEEINILKAGKGTTQETTQGTITAIQALTDNAATWACLIISGQQQDLLADYWKFVQEMKEAFEDSQL